MNKSDKADKTDFLFRELQIDYERAKQYFDYMYRCLQITFAAIITLILFGVEKITSGNLSPLVLTIAMPCCLYVFGSLYAYNAYSLAVCGKQLNLLQQGIMEMNSIDSITDKKLNSFVLTKRSVAILAYGLPLGFYIVAPAFSVIIGLGFYASPDLLFWIAIATYLLYVLIMVYIIINIILNYGHQRKEQKR